VATGMAADACGEHAGIANEAQRIPDSGKLGGRELHYSSITGPLVLRLRRRFRTNFQAFDKAVRYIPSDVLEDGSRQAWIQGRSASAPGEQCAGDAGEKRRWRATAGEFILARRVAI